MRLCIILAVSKRWEYDVFNTQNLIMAYEGYSAHRDSLGQGDVGSRHYDMGRSRLAPFNLVELTRRRNPPGQPIYSALRPVHLSPPLTELVHRIIAPAFLIS